MVDCKDTARWIIIPVSATTDGGVIRKPVMAGAVKIAFDVNGNGTLPSDNQLCWGYSHADKSCTGCLTLVSCNKAPVFQRLHSGSLVNAATKQCVDLSDAGTLGAWVCGGDGKTVAQPNQRFAVDPSTGFIGTLDAGYHTAHAGQCVGIVEQ